MNAVVAEGVWKFYGDYPALRDVILDAQPTKQFVTFDQLADLYEEQSAALIAGGVDGLFHGWQASADVLGKLCSGTDRWHALIRQMQTPVNFADILRARALL